MANRLFNLPETRGNFRITGMSHVAKGDRFYKSKLTQKTKAEWRSVNFGVEYDEDKTVYVQLGGMPRDKVWFSKRDEDTGRFVTQDVPWRDRKTFNEDGYNLIGVRLGLDQEEGADGSMHNLSVTETEFDACLTLSKKLKNNIPVFVKGSVDYSTYTRRNGDRQRNIQLVPNQISLSKEFTFDEFAEMDRKLQNRRHCFDQKIVYMGIEKEHDEFGAATGRFIVNAKIVTYSDIVDAEFIVLNEKAAMWFKKNMKPYWAINVSGLVEVVHDVVDVEDEDDGFEESPTKMVRRPSKMEFHIISRDVNSIDEDTYSEDLIDEAMAAIHNHNSAEANFKGAAKNTDDDDDGFDADEDWA